ncbi:MAG TPA: ribonuclease P protein subunit [Candidatus Thalassarchaeaceae archaeon]|nr:ribonuclease P protein subunit [Candidatus Thalassarchaeaceae archaeon]
MTRMINLPWISHNLTVLESNDPSLVGVSGTVVEETKRTIIVRTESREVALAKDIIKFTIDSGEPIIGSLVTQRAEERIGRRY